jgi:glucose-6-phosphate 1-dehydrogenase
MSDARPRTLLVLGASGDLTGRLLRPALGQLLTAEPERRIVLVGSGAEELGPDQWRTKVRAAFDSADATDRPSTTCWPPPATSADVTTREGMGSVLTGCEGLVAIYFALPLAGGLGANGRVRGWQCRTGGLVRSGRPS